MKWTYYDDLKMWSEPNNIIGKAYIKWIRKTKYYKTENYTRNDYEIDLQEIDGKLLKFRDTHIKGERIIDILTDRDIIDDGDIVSIGVEAPEKPFSGPIIIRSIQGKNLRLPYLIAEYGHNQMEIDDSFYHKVNMVPATIKGNRDGRKKVIE